MEQTKQDNIWWIIALAAVLIRIAYAVPGMLEPSLVMRIDSASYLGPAASLLKDGAYNMAPGGAPAFVRTPFYPFVLALLLGVSGSSLSFCILISAVAGGLIAVPIYFSARLFVSRMASAAATLLFVLNPTAIALSVMFLSDNFFCLMIALEVYFFLRFFKSGAQSCLFLSAAFSGAAILVRPLNLFWIFPCIFVVMLYRNYSFSKRIFSSLISLLIVLCILAPWVIRNNSLGAGWRIDAVSADTALHNCSALESRLTGIPGEELRRRYRAEGTARFASEPDQYATSSARYSYYEGKLAEMIRNHPVRYFLLHIRPVVLLPDAASFLENLGLAQTGKGTWDIINRNGIFAGIRHYFNGSYFLPLMLTPLLLISLILYLLAGWNLLESLWKRRWMELLLFLLLSEYYLFMTGPVAMPRYQLAALPYFCVMAAFAVESIRKRLSERSASAAHKH